MAPENFRRWALQQLRALIPFDAAIWGSGNRQIARFQNVTVDGLPPDFARALESTARDNPLFREVQDHWGEPVAMSDVLSDRKFYKSDLYQRAFKPYGVERILSSGNMEQRSGLQTLLSIYRFDRERDFTEQEKAIQGQVLYHLIASASHAFFLTISRPKSGVRREWNAVCDRTGVFHEVELKFMDLLEQAFPNWSGQRLPFDMPPVDFSGEIGGGLCLRVEPLGDVFLLHLRESGPLDELTQRERDVVLQVCEGLSAKAIGRNLDLAPSTVSTHLYRAYRKLGVESRTNLAKLVKSLRD
ncbi:response regulator [Oceanococcus atlanticus]|uniref:Response regulator n=1 Tax=Oceanococcus atlanticus TaxID=1317117 RepID=A0A1Y1SGD5_9GAMM|nr:helix-turn-helix transcriptional regulator [Oceanococcus atlanticus]ORE88717.1 response regulator [Oceanococcus atlanticus]